MHVALPPQKTHLVFRIDIAALVYEQPGHIGSIMDSRHHQGGGAILRSHARQRMLSIDMRVYAHKIRTIGMHRMHAMFPACCVALRAVHKHGVSLTTLVMPLQCMWHYRRKTHTWFFALTSQPLSMSSLATSSALFAAANIKAVLLSCEVTRVHVQ